MEKNKVFPEIAPLRRRTGPDDPGHVVEGHYILDGDTVVLTDGDGNPLTRGGRRAWGSDQPARWEMKLGEGSDPGALARQMLRDRYWASKGGDFNRPLKLPPLSIA